MSGTNARKDIVKLDIIVVFPWDISKSRHVNKMIEIMIALAFDLEKNSYDKTFSVQQDDQSMFIGTPSHLFSTHKLYAQEICFAGLFQMFNETSTLSQFIHVLLTDSFLRISETIFSKLNQFFLTKPFFI